MAVVAEILRWRLIRPAELEGLADRARMGPHRAVVAQAARRARTQAPAEPTATASPRAALEEAEEAGRTDSLSAASPALAQRVELPAAEVVEVVASITPAESRA